MLIIHYHRDTGQISAWGNGWSEDSHVPDHEVLAVLDEPESIDPRTQRIDVATGTLIDKTSAEIEIENAPRLVEVQWLVRTELAATDALMMPDREVPDRAAWTVYRQALRDVSKLPDLAAMIDGWPVRPDTLDVIADLRSRLNAARAAQPLETT